MSTGGGFPDGHARHRPARDSHYGRLVDAAEELSAAWQAWSDATLDAADDAEPAFARLAAAIRRLRVVLAEHRATTVAGRHPVGKAWHMAVEVEGSWRPACDTATYLMGALLAPAASVVEGDRCRRRACATRWP